MTMIKHLEGDSPGFQTMRLRNATNRVEKVICFMFHNVKYKLDKAEDQPVSKKTTNHRLPHIS